MSCMHGHGRQGLHAAAIHALHAVVERGVGVQPALHAAAAGYVHQQHVLHGRVGQAGVDGVLGIPGRGVAALGHDLAQHTTQAIAAAGPLHRACVGQIFALALLQRALGSLDAVQSILRITVYVQSAPTFTQQSEVADGASEVLFAVLGDAGAHTRTSVGVLQLPKNATVEVDLIASVRT